MAEVKMALKDMIEQITLAFFETPPYARKMGLALSMDAEYRGTRAAGSREPFDMKDDNGKPFKVVRPTLNSPYCREVAPITLHVGTENPHD